MERTFGRNGRSITSSWCRLDKIYTFNNSLMIDLLGREAPCKRHKLVLSLTSFSSCSAIVLHVCEEEMEFLRSRKVLSKSHLLMRRENRNQRHGPARSTRIVEEKNTSYKRTSCPARRCSGIRAPLNFIASLLWLRSASSLPDRSLNPQITPVEKLCSALNFCWFENKRPFSNGKTFTLLVTSCPGGSLPYCFSRSSHCRAETCFFSVQSLSLFQPLSVSDWRLHFAGGPPSKLLSL